MKKIGFIDYYLGEWHANNYPKWFRQASEKLGVDYRVCYAWAEKDISPANNVSTKEWCEEQQIEECLTIDELCEKSDVIVILAPSDPQKHLQYAKQVFKYKKPTYIDKTFAPDLAEAREIYALGKENNVSFFSTSALRYAVELDGIKGKTDIIITGGGSNFPEYIIHTVEMAVVLGNRYKRAMVQKIGAQRMCTLEKESGERNIIIFSPASEFAVLGNDFKTPIESDFFALLILDIVRFFETGRLPFEKEQTLSVMAIRTALLKAEETEGTWIEI